MTFTIECDPVSISFLDVSVYIYDRKLHTDLYQKPTDRNTILRGDGFHHRPLIKSLPISQFNLTCFRTIPNTEICGCKT